MPSGQSRSNASCRQAQPRDRPRRTPPASPGTARCWPRGAHRRPPGWSPATSPALRSSLSSRASKRSCHPSSVSSNTCSGNSTRGAPRRSSAATMRRASSAKPAGSDSLVDVLVGQLGPAVDHRSLDAVESRLTGFIDAHGEHDGRTRPVGEQARRRLRQRRRIQRHLPVGQVHRAAALPGGDVEDAARVDEEPDVGDGVVQHDVVARRLDGEGLVEIGRRRRVERHVVDRRAIDVSCARLCVRRPPRPRRRPRRETRPGGRPRPGSRRDRRTIAVDRRLRIVTGVTSCVSSICV